MTFIWSGPALDDFDSNIHFLEKRFSKKEAISFIDELERTLAIIKKKPKTFKETGYKNIREALIAPQISLFYTIHKSHIEIVRLWNNHMDKRNFKPKG